jgi:hypothetical protein
MTEHFTQKELEYSATGIRLGLSNKCPDDLLPNMQHVAERLELVRAHFGKPVRVLSCYRSPAVNTAVGGSATSAHRFAHAADFVVSGVSVLEVCKWCAENIPDYDQIIYEFGEDGWCHIGFTRKTPRKQLLTAKKAGGKTKYTGGFHE